MRWAEKQRLAFIGRRLLAGETVNRADLVHKFGVSVPQASTDIRRFKEAHPGAMKYDLTLKTYVADKLTPSGRDTTAAAGMLMRADDSELRMIMLHDPSMIRDVAAALIFERG
jgi:hypothetical protein